MIGIVNGPGCQPEHLAFQLHQEPNLVRRRKVVGDGCFLFVFAHYFTGQIDFLRDEISKRQPAGACKYSLKMIYL